MLLSAERAFCVALACANGAAITSWLVQWRGLIGSNGVTPAARLIAGVDKHVFATATPFEPDVGKLPSFLKGRLYAYFRALQLVPSVFTITGASDLVLEASLLLAYALCAWLALGSCGASLCAALLAVIWASHVGLAKPWLSLQMDTKLVETNVLFAVTFLFKDASPALWVWGQRALLFRIMLACAAAKAGSGDPSWKTVSTPAMAWHYFTQPLPNGVSRRMHFLPVWAHGVEVAFTFLLEGLLPLAYLSASHTTRALAFLLTAGFNLAIGATGNYGHLHLLMTAISVPLLAETSSCASTGGAASSSSQQSLPWYALPLTCPHPVSLWQVPLKLAVGAVGWGVLFCYCAVATVPLAHAWQGLIEVNVSPPLWDRLTALWKRLQAFHLVGYYSKFSHMTKFRWELQLEGTVDGGVTWVPFSYLAKPGGGPESLHVPPPTLLPGYRPTLDWRQWFVPLAAARVLHKGSTLASLPVEAWYRSFEEAVLRGSPDVLDLIVVPPLLETAARDGRLHAVRTVIYDYRFTDDALLAEMRLKDGRFGAVSEAGEGSAAGGVSPTSLLKPPSSHRPSDAGSEPTPRSPSRVGLSPAVGEGASGDPAPVSASPGEGPPGASALTPPHRRGGQKTQSGRLSVRVEDEGEGVGGAASDALKHLSARGPVRPCGCEQELVPEAWLTGVSWEVGSVWSRRFVSVYDVVTRQGAGVQLVPQMHTRGDRLPAQPGADFPGLDGDASDDE